MNIKYTKRIVAFIDVLGFKNLVLSPHSDRIERYFNLLLSKFSEAAVQKNMEYLLISDSIVIYCDNTKDNLQNIIKLVSVLQSKLLIEGILIRGSISSGDLYVDKENNIIVGPGLVNSYTLESIAKYPRVIIDRRLIKEHFDSTTIAIESTTSGSRPHLTTAPHNGGMADYAYIHYGRTLSNTTAWKHYEEVINLFKREFYKNEHIEKFEWLRKYLKSSLRDSIEYFQQKEKPSVNERNKLRYCRRTIEALSTL